MTTVQNISGELWVIPIPLPGSPLKNLNSYVIKGGKGERDLLIDTGFPNQICLKPLLDGMKELGLEPEKTDVFISHLHSDHSGNAGVLQEMGCRVMMSEVDHRIIAEQAVSGWRFMEDNARREGIPETLIKRFWENCADRAFRAPAFAAETLSNGQQLSYGNFSLTCIHTPGHTPGHMCLYDSQKKIMFTGDHVLFDISPNIALWPGMEDPLGTYMENLEKMLGYDVTIALPAHRNTGELVFPERVRALLQHHEDRLAEAWEILAANGGSTVYQAAEKMKWKIHAKSWEDFPIAQKWFACGETAAHFNCLKKRKQAECEDRNGVLYYFPAG